MSELPTYIVQHLDKIAKANGLIDYRIETKAGSNHGDNFISEMLCVALIGKRNDAENGQKIDDRLDLLCKLAPSNEVRRKEFKANLIFTRETFAYNKLFPTFVNFQKERGLTESESFISFPKCYLAVMNEENEEYLIIMDDLRTKGYSMWPKNKPISLAHCKLVVQELAKFHAVSYALKDQKPEVFEEFKQINDIYRQFYDSPYALDFMKKLYNKLIDSLKSEEYKVILATARDNFLQYLKDVLDEEVNEELGILTHGDIWNNNIIYHYQNGDKEPNKLCILDWQVIRHCSPVVDLHYNLFTATDKELRDKEYENLLDLYYATLSQNITKMGSDPEKLISRAEFHRQLKRFGNFVLLTAPMIIQIALAKPKDIPNLDELWEQFANGDGETPEWVNFGEEDQEKLYIERIEEVVADVLKYDYFRK